MSPEQPDLSTMRLLSKEEFDLCVDDASLCGMFIFRTYQAEDGTTQAERIAVTNFYRDVPTS